MGFSEVIICQIRRTKKSSIQINPRNIFEHLTVTLASYKSLECGDTDLQRSISTGTYNKSPICLRDSIFERKDCNFIKVRQTFIETVPSNSSSFFSINIESSLMHLLLSKVDKFLTCWYFLWPFDWPHLKVDRLMNFL